jgi:catalase
MYAACFTLVIGAAAAPSLLQFSFLLDDVGVPLNYRHMEGFGVHTFMLLNKAGRETLVKFHWKPSCGENATAEFLV